MASEPSDAYSTNSSVTSMSNNWKYLNIYLISHIFLSGWKIMTCRYSILRKPRQTLSSYSLKKYKKTFTSLQNREGSFFNITVANVKLFLSQTWSLNYISFLRSVPLFPRSVSWTTYVRRRNTPHSVRQMKSKPYANVHTCLCSKIIVFVFGPGWEILALIGGTTMVLSSFQNLYWQNT